MKQLFSFCFLLLVYSQIPTEDHVITMSPDNFEEIINSNEFVLVEFYAPWCAHCQTLAPEYQKAAAQLRNSNPPVYLGKVDATIHKDLAEKFNVKGFPTMIFFTNGKSREYEGGREEQEIVDWCLKKVLPSTSELHSSSEVDEKKNKNQNIVVYFGNEDDQKFKIYESVTKEIESVVFYHVFKQNVSAYYGFSQPSLVLFKSEDNEIVNYDQKIWDIKSITEFIKIRQLPSMNRFDSSLAEIVFELKQPTFFLLFSRNQPADRAGVANWYFQEVSKVLKGKIIMCTADIASKLGNKLAGYLDISEKDTPAIRIVSYKGDKFQKFLFSGSIKTDQLLQFYEDYANNLLKPQIKSQPIPEAYSFPVVEVVALNFEQIVLDTTKDVLLMIYAPWCGHCKKMSPVLDQLALHFQGYPQIIIAKIDATANEVSGADGYPTIIFYGQNDKNGIVYKGQRTLDDLVQFLSSKTIAKREDL